MKLIIPQAALLLLGALNTLSTVVHIEPYDRQLLDYLQFLSGDPAIRTDLWHVSRDDGLVLHVESYDRLVDAIQRFQKDEIEETQREAADQERSFAIRLVMTKEQLQAAVEMEKSAIREATTKLYKETLGENAWFSQFLSPSIGSILQRQSSIANEIEDYKTSFTGAPGDQGEDDTPILYDDRWFRTYHPLDVIKKWYKGLAAEFPNYVEFIPSISKKHKTYEGREIFAVRLTEKDGVKVSKDRKPEAPKKKKQIYVQSLIHAREWISGAVAQYLTLHLLKDHKPLLSDFEFLIVPVVNPDGYHYTWTNSRLWRKNRKPNDDKEDNWWGGHSFGVDINRNFDIEWHMGGSSSSGNAEDYAGPYAGSESETKALMEFFEANEGIIGVICLHSFSQLILRPWGWASLRDPVNHVDECYHKNKEAAFHAVSGDFGRPMSRGIPPEHRGRAPHEAQLARLSSNMASRIRSAHGQTYVAELVGDLYTATGTAQDWFYSVTRHDNATELKWRAAAYTIELRPRPKDNWWNPGQGFILDPKYIMPTAEEIWEAFVPYVKEVSEDILYC